MNKKIRTSYQKLATTSVLVIAAGTIFYNLVEKWSLIDSFYFCVVTLATVGYGDFTPKTQLGRLVTSFYIIVGVAILGSFLNTMVKHRAERAEARRAEHNKQA